MKTIKTMMSLKIDADVKERATRTAEAMGIPLGTVANILLRQFAQDKELHISLAYNPSDYLKEAIRESKEEVITKKLKQYKGSDELFKALKI